MIPGSANPLLLAPAAGGYQVSRSLRFNSSDSAYLSRTPAVAGNRRTWTWSSWIKSGSAVNTLMGANNAYNNWAAFGMDASSFFIVEAVPTAQYHLNTTAVYRDPSAWMHVVVAFDTTQSIAADRIKLYINNSQVTTFSTSTYPALNYQTHFNNTTSHYIGRLFDGAFNYWTNGYLAECYLIDGQQLTPSSFTEVSATTGQLIPKAYSGGSYGTNGFYLQFADNSSNTAATLGKDTSGNSNNWTPNNLSVTAGAGNDSLVDTPTSFGTDTGVGGEVRGNYATLNPLQSSATLSNGNLDCTTTSVSWQANVGTIFQSSGKWYSEVTVTSIGAGGIHIGIVGPNYSVAAGNYIGNTATSYAYRADGTKYNNGSAAAYGATYTTNDVIGIAMDLDAGSLVFYKNGASQGTAYTSMTGEKAFAVSVGSTTGTHSVVLNAGQRAFAYTAPSGFKALCDTNLPAPVVAKPNTLMDVKLYTGNGTGQAITGLAFSPDFIWTKSRSRVDSHGLHDIVRGRASNLYSDLTAAENTSSLSADLVSFDANGYTLGTVEQTAMNRSGETYVGWAWDAGTSTVSNTAGSITSQVRANPTAGFSVVGWTSNGTAGIETTGHGLGVSPDLIIVKNRDASSPWQVFHSSFSNTASDYLFLNTTDAKVTSGATIWTRSSTTFGYRQSSIFTNGQKGIAYCFAAVVGYSSFGSYVGNGSSDGPMVYTGFRPRFLIFKRTDTTGAWFMEDSSRGTYNVMGPELYANASDAEATSNRLDFLSNGFKLRSGNAGDNASGGTYIYMAFAENPLQYARAR